MSELLASYGKVKIRKAEDSPAPIYELEQPTDALTALKTLLEDDELEEIVFNGPSRGLQLYHRRYGLCRTNARIEASDVPEVLSWLYEMMGYASPEFPVVEGRLPDGSRVSVATAPVAVDGPYFSIRKFPRNPFTLRDLVKFGMMSPDVAALLSLYVDGLGVRPANILIAGGTGSGKTTLLSSLAQLIPKQSRIVIIEDTPEISLEHPNMVRLTVTPIHFERQVDMEMLLRASLRMRPDRLIVGEVRGREAETLLAAMNTGHLGSMGTIHANTSQEAIKRLTNPPMNVPPQMLAALDLIITTAKINTGSTTKRVILEISETAGFDEKGPRLNQLYKYSISEDRIIPTGIPSSFRERFIKETGINREKYNEILHEKASEFINEEEMSDNAS